MSGFPFFISELNRAMISDDAFDSMRLSGALAQTKASPFSCSFWTPNYCDMGMFSAMPFYTPVMNHLLDPNLAIWQSQNSMQNGCFDAFNGGFGGFGTGFSDMGASNIGPMGTMMGNMGNFGGFGGGMGGIGMGGMFPGQQGGSVGGSGKTQAEKIANNEYNSLKTSAQKIANIKGLDPNVKSTLTAALNKGGTIEEKKQALKDAIATIGDKNIFKEAAIVDFKEDLAKIGYSFPTLKYFESGSTTTNDAKNVHHFVDELEVNLQQEGGEVDQFLSACAKNIIPVISYWNDNSSHKNIIKFLAHQGKETIPTDETKNKKAANAIHIMAQALESEALDLCSGNAEGTSNLKSAKNALASARAKLNRDGKLTEQQVSNLSDAFNKLYVQIRMYKAQDVRNKVLKKYESLNDLEKGLIPDDIIVAETIEDLKREGFAAPTSYDRISRPKKVEVTIKEEKSNFDNKPAKEQLNNLVSKKVLTKTNNEDIYKSEDDKYYAIIKDSEGNETLSEISGITIDSEGKINGEYETISEAIGKNDNIKTVARTHSYVQNYQGTQSTIDKLVADKRILDGKDGKNYRSRYKDENGKQVDYEISDSGNLVLKGTNTIVTENMIPSSDTYREETQQERLQRLINEGKIEQYYGADGKTKIEGVYISTGTSNGDIGYHQFFTFTPKLGLKKVKGVIVKHANGHYYIYNENKYQSAITAIQPKDVESFNDDDVWSGRGNYNVDNEETKTEEKTKEKESEKNNIDMNSDNMAYTVGKKDAQTLWIHTNSEDLKTIVKHIKSLDKDSVLKYISGYRSNDNCQSGFFEQLGHNWSKAVRLKDVLPMVKLILEAFDEYKDTKDYLIIQDAYNQLLQQSKDKPGCRFDDEDLSPCYKRWFGKGILDKLDDAIYRLLDTMEEES